MRVSFEGHYVLAEKALVMMPRVSVVAGRTRLDVAIVRLRRFAVPVPAMAAMAAMAEQVHRHEGQPENDPKPICSQPIHGLPS